MEDSLDITSNTSVDWRSFACEVTDSWFTQQDPIGGPGIIVEIDETVIVRRKYNRGRELSSIWLFGGIERESKKKFIVSLEGEKRDKATLWPIILKYIRPGSVIFSDCWKAYINLNNDDEWEGGFGVRPGYGHSSVNHSENFLHPVDPTIHTQNIERTWRDLKKWVKKPGIRSQYLYQYLARYLFIEAHTKAQLLHCFFKKLQSCTHLWAHDSVALYLDQSRTPPTPKPTNKVRVKILRYLNRSIIIKCQ